MKSLQMSRAAKARHEYHRQATHERDLRIVELRQQGYNSLAKIAELVGLRSETAVSNVIRRMEAAAN